MSKDFLAFRPSEAEAILLGLQSKLSPRVAGDSVVLLAVLTDLPSEAERINGHAHVKFQKTCERIVREFGGATPSVRNGEPHNLVCGWFSKDKVIDAARAMMRIQVAMLSNKMQQDGAILLTLGRHAYAASKLLEITASEHGVVDEVIWNTFEKNVHLILEDGNIHSADSDAIRKHCAAELDLSVDGLLAPFVHPSSESVPVKSRTNRRVSTASTKSQRSRKASSSQGSRRDRRS
jgi:hypothetical protein